MPSRLDHLDDLTTRLLGKTNCGNNVFRSRVAAVDEGKLPAICVYAPTETGTPLGAGHPQYQMTVTLMIEIRLSDSTDWDLKTGVIVEQVKNVLFTDPAWTGRWVSAPDFRVQQYLEDKAHKPFVGEVIEMTCRVADPDEYVIANADDLLTVAIDVNNPDQTDQTLDPELSQILTAP